MNKKIIAIAIASAMAAPVAMADIKVSGRVGGHLTNTNTSPATTTFADNGQTRLQFDGTSGKAFARIALDERLGRDNAAGNSYTRTKRGNFAGYKFDAASISFGRMGGAVKNIAKDPYIGTFLEARGTFGMNGGQFGSSSFIDHVIQAAGKSGAVKWKVQYDIGSNTAASAHEGHTGLAVSTKVSGANVWVGYNNGRGSETTGDTNTIVGASMKFGAIKATLQLENNKTATTDSARTLIMANMGLGNGLSANAALGTTTKDSKGTWMRVGVAKELSKGATFYGGFVSSKADGASAVNTSGIGLTVKF